MIDSSLEPGYMYEDEHIRAYLSHTRAFRSPVSGTTYTPNDWTRALGQPDVILRSQIINWLRTQANIVAAKVSGTTAAPPGVGIGAGTSGVDPAVGLGVNVATTGGILGGDYVWAPIAGNRASGGKMGAPGSAAVGVGLGPVGAEQRSGAGIGEIKDGGIGVGSGWGKSIW